MKVKIEIETDGAAFEDNHDEMKAVCRQAAKKFNDMCVRLIDVENLYDTNGNRCGTITLVD